MADREHVEQLQQGVDTWNKWRQDHPDIYPDLSYANLSHAKLTEADLSYANLSHAKLTGTDLSHAKLNSVIFNNTHFLATIFAWVDLSSAKGLDMAVHEGPSLVASSSVIFPLD